ncbi:MAG: undecaprenyl/decaprenyl-phosphate alpha-N-acetylglucosaminyl 1-phosphate transferase [Phycisphaerales bacterium]|nr:undecaprenyl/decaprenyl-phosphate alpha-N-acetylglucosaminyl 1-phosphate transferase [Phycisphaerales bacterium]
MPIATMLALGCSFALSAVATWLVRSIARRRGFIDQPGGHKQHHAPVALGGGIAITWTVVTLISAGTLLAMAWSRGAAPDWLPPFFRMHLDGINEKAPVLFAILAGVVVLHVVGFIDDVRPLGPAVKMVVQTIVALFVAVFAGVRVLDLETLPVWCSILLTVVWIVGVTNAFNFLDNMDGLSAGVAVIAGTIFAATGIAGGQIFVPVFTLILVGALLGFLLFNFQPATIFMGDSGSLVVGYLMAVLIALTTFYDPTRSLKPAGVFLPLVVLAVPVYDAVSVCVHRLRAGVSIFRGDRRHFSHRLVQRGLSERAAVLTIYLATAATSSAAILLPHVDWPAACLIFAQCVFVVLIIAILEHAGRRE